MQEEQKEQKKKWFQTGWGIIVWLILFFPVGLFLMWKHANWNTLVKGIITVVFVLLVMVANALGDSQTSSLSSTTDTKEEHVVENEAEVVEEPLEVTYQVNQKIEGKDLAVTVTKIETHQSVGGQYFEEEASDGGILVSVDFSYTNTSDKPLKSFKKPSVKLVDQNGTEYNSDLGKSSAYATQVDLDRKILSDLNPGISVSDADVFEVSEASWESGEWHVQVKIGRDEYKVMMQ